MLKNLIGEFDDLKYDNRISMCCSPGADISQVPVLLANNCEKSIDLLIVNCGVNNIINGYSVNNCMYLYEKTHDSIKLTHPNSIVAFTSISFIVGNNLNDIDTSVDINPLISELNEALESYCLLKESTEFIDLRPYLSTNGDTSNIERTNLARDGLHYSKRGIKMVAKALIYETDRFMAAKLDTQNEQDFKVDDTWPYLPNPSLKSRIHPAQYPGQQFLECKPNGKCMFITENKMPVQKQQTVEKPVSFTPKTIRTEKTNKNKHKIRYTQGMETKSYTKSSTECHLVTKPDGHKTCNRVDQHEFKMPLSNKFQCLKIEESTKVNSDQNQIPHLASLKNNGSTIRKKYVKINRKKKISKLECAANGANGTRVVCNQTPKTLTFRIGMRHAEYSYPNLIQFNPVPVATKDLPSMSAEYFYHNPHRQSPFDSLLWTKCGFIQRNNYTPGPLSYFSGKMKINHNETDVEKRGYDAAQYAFLFLLLSGDIETNPGPRTKRKSVETKNRQNKLKRVNESEDEKVKRLQKVSRCKKRALENESSKEKRIRLECETLRIQSIRDKETNEQMLMRLNSSAKQMAETRSLETPAKKIKRLESVSKQIAKSRSEETPEKRSLRLKSVSNQMAKSRSEETPEKRSLRLTSKSKQMAKSRSEETPEKRSLRLTSVLKQMAKSRSEETQKKRSLRLKSDTQHKAKVRSEETPEKRSLRLQSVSKQMANFRANRGSITKSSDDIVMEFLSKTRTAADYVCCCCNRMMYASGVVSFNTEKYEKISSKLMEKICQYRVKSYDRKEWVCITCHRNLKLGNMPQQAKCNGLSLCKIPEELKDLNPLEMRLISRRIPFMKLVSLPRGRQQGIQGPAVNVPTDLDFVCDQFPRLPNQCHLISLKLKRKLEYRKSYMHDFVYPDRVIKGLKWLKEHNPLYHDICINNDWAVHSKQCDPNLWNAMTNENINDDISDLDTTGGNSCTSNEVNEQDDTSGELGQYVIEKYTVALQRLQQRAKERGFQIFDVPRDGDCLFSATCHELKKHGLFDGNKDDLRGDLAQFMRCNPVCDSDGSQYKDFLPARFESDNPLNDDTGRPDNRDKAIEKIANEEERKRQRWQLYLERLEHTKEWGDPLAIKGLVERFQVNIHISSSETTYISVHEPYNGSSINLHMGLILQYHYVALDKCIESHSNENEINT